MTDTRGLTPGFTAYLSRRGVAADFELVTHCDGPGCTARFEGTRKSKRAAGWDARWRRIEGTGTDEQIDLCPQCRRGDGIWPPKPRST